MALDKFSHFRITDEFKELLAERLFFRLEMSVNFMIAEKTKFSYKNARIVLRGGFTENHLDNSLPKLKII